MPNHPTTDTVGSIVATDFRAAAILERFGIDFCCGGRRSLAEACRAASADPAVVVRALEEELTHGPLPDGVTTQWSVEALIDHIVSRHHAYVRQAVPTIRRYLMKVIDAHGERHPELHRVYEHFVEIGTDLEQHLVKEEQVLFPYIRTLADNAKETCGAVLSPFGTIANPIRMMEREHRETAEGLRLIRSLTRNYTAPPDGCTTYALCVAELRRFEEDLHRHVHLENNVLFPKALELEGRDE